MRGGHQPLRRPRVAMRTSCGLVVAEIFTDRAPLTARNFLQYVDLGYYQYARFYRSVRRDNAAEHYPLIQIIQGGIDPSARRAPLPAIPHESTRVTGLSHLEGTLSAVRLAPGTAASEFFIVIGDTPALDFDQADFGTPGSPDRSGYAVFGRVIEGMTVVRNISSGRTGKDDAVEYMNGQALVEPIEMQISRVPATQPVDPRIEGWL